MYEKRLASLIKKNINDTDKVCCVPVCSLQLTAAQTVRSSARQLFLAFANVWPQLAHKYGIVTRARDQRTWQVV